MPASRRLADLEKALELRYETLGKAEKRLAITDEIFAKNAIEQRIREEVLPELRQCEAEYWEVLAQEARTCAVEEVEAQNAIDVVVQEVELIENNPNANYPAELLNLLREIRDTLKEPETPVEGKAKLALNLLPGIITYEVELDTEKALRRVKEPFKRLFRGAIEKK
ncbi:hypothetical protein [Argonema galeatum]|uniref:hypothetical protein n=1 Tax=Argonema galeatum TaxID=2942762 RepID=UPI0020133C92|nr:hypothetical protein [Argonema galeatum]MCL1463819.1 hypothetical protein [Argonema galeatum A003/A1]